MQLDKAWKITEFSKMIDKHYNTVDQWFKALEDKHVHYVNRIAGEKVYDVLDLEIGKYIKESRDKNFNLQMIFEQLPQIYDVRPFPEDWISGDALWDIEAIRRTMEQKFDEKFQHAKSEIREEAIAAAKLLLDDHQKALPAPKSMEELQSERVNEIMTRLKLEKRLEDEAIEQWSLLPESERLRKVGLFRKDEDWGKRDAFIRRFVRDRMLDALKEEYGIIEGRI
jgi:DNA-binding transcriptional MerR regulator